MKYFEEMNSKWGFCDGEATPPDAEVLREVYVRVFNALLAKHHSECRILPFNRGGCHNNLMWVRIPVAHFDKIEASEPHWWTNGEYDSLPPDVDTDAAWDTAIEEAENLNLDELVQVKVTINETAIKEVLTEIAVQTDAITK